MVYSKAVCVYKLLVTVLKIIVSNASNLRQLSFERDGAVNESRHIVAVSDVQ